MYIRKTAPQEIGTDKLIKEYRKLAEAKKTRNRKLHTTGRYHRLATRIARRLYEVREVLRQRGCPKERIQA